MSNQSQPSPDLELVRRLLWEIEREGLIDNKLAIAVQARVALPALRSLLAEVERLREENADLNAESWKIISFSVTLLLETKKLSNTVLRLREENLRMKAAITKAAEEGLSSNQNPGYTGSVYIE